MRSTASIHSDLHLLYTGHAKHKRIIGASCRGPQRKSGASGASVSTRTPLSLSRVSTGSASCNRTWSSRLHSTDPVSSHHSAAAYLCLRVEHVQRAGGVGPPNLMCRNGQGKGGSTVSMMCQKHTIHIQTTYNCR